MIANILSIAGSDPSGGAGIQADIKAISANGGYAMAALTGLTAQNTRGVSRVELVEPGMVAAQIEAVRADIRVDAVKIGMLGSAEIIAAVAGALDGIGEWTAHYIAMRALREPDAFPSGDLGLRRALAGGGKPVTPSALERRAESWRPWRAYAAIRLWMAPTPILEKR